MIINFVARVGGEGHTFGLHSCKLLLGFFRGLERPLGCPSNKSTHCAAHRDLDQNNTLGLQDGLSYYQCGPLAPGSMQLYVL